MEPENKEMSTKKKVKNALDDKKDSVMMRKKMPMQSSDNSGFGRCSPFRQTNPSDLNMRLVKCRSYNQASL